MENKQKQKNFPTGWKLVRLGDVADPNKKWSFTGGPFGSNLKQTSYADTGVRIIQLQNIGDGVFLNDYKIFTTEKKAKELLSCNIYPGEIILSKMGDPVARACLIPDFDSNYLMASDGIRLAPNQKIFDTYFVFLAINSKYFRKMAEDSSTGSTRKRIGLSDLKNLKLYVPSLLEQQRIVGVLKTWDDMIEKLRDKIEIKKRVKKGLMRELLTGKTRLPGFRGKWKTIKLGNVGQIISGGTPDTNNKEYWDGDVAWITPTEITKLKGKYITTTKRTITQSGLKNSSATLIPANSLIICSRATVGDCAINTKEITTNQGFKNIIPSGINIEYLYYLITTKKSFLKRISSGSTFLEFSKKDLEKIKISIPSIREQTAITDVLVTTDGELEGLERKLAILKNQKRFLLNNLVTGEIRVPEGV